MQTKQKNQKMLQPKNTELLKPTKMIQNTISQSKSHILQSTIEQKIKANESENAQTRKYPYVKTNKNEGKTQIFRRKGEYLESAIAGTRGLHCMLFIFFLAYPTLNHNPTTFDHPSLLLWTPLSSSSCSSTVSNSTHILTPFTSHSSTSSIHWFKACWCYDPIHTHHEVIHHLSVSPTFSL